MALAQTLLILVLTLVGLLAVLAVGVGWWRARARRLAEDPAAARAAPGRERQVLPPPPVQGRSAG